MPRGGHGGVSIGEAGGNGSNTSGNHNSDRSGSSSRGLGERPLGKFTFHGERDRELKRDRDREMVGGCCVCSDERGWDENPLVYCDGHGCNVAVHQACYGIVSVPTGPWFCRKCESTERAARVRCELCPNKDGGLKRTDSNSWAHVVCALYIPEVRFGNVSTMEPIVLGLVPQERYLKVCYLCEQQGRESRASSGACMQCNKSGCKQSFHVTCAQRAGLLCEEAGNYMDNVKYCGYCEYHYQRINKKFVKMVPAYRPSNPSNSVFDRISDDERNSPRSTSSPDHKRGNFDSESVNSTSSPAITKSLNNTSTSVTYSTSNLSSTSGGCVPGGSNLNETKGDRGGGDSSSVVSSSSSSSKKGKKGRKPNSEKGSAGSTDGKVEPADASSTTSGTQNPDKTENSDDRVELNANNSLSINSDEGASNSNTKDCHASSPTSQNLKDLTSSSIHLNSQNSTSIHANQLTDDPNKKDSSSLSGGISSRPGDVNNESSRNGISGSASSTKPPSVIVKFGKQDGTYYSKKDPTPSSQQPEQMSSSSSMDITASSSSTLISTSSSANCINDNGNLDTSSMSVTNRSSASTSQSHSSHSRQHHRHGKKHSSSSLKGSHNDTNDSITTTDSPSVTSNNGFDSLKHKEKQLYLNQNKLSSPVDSTPKKTDSKSSSQVVDQNDKGNLDSHVDPYNKGFTSANFTQSVVTPTSSIGASLFNKETDAPKTLQNQPSIHPDKEHYRAHATNSVDKRHVNHSSHGNSAYPDYNKSGSSNSVTTSLVKNEPLDFIKKDSNHEPFTAASSRPSTGPSQNSDTSFLQDKANVDLKITKYGVTESSFSSKGKLAQGYGHYNKHPYESSSSSRGDKISTSSVTVSKSSHNVPEHKKDSPAKILPISASSTSPEKSGINSGSTGSASFGRPLKVEISSGSASLSSSLEVSPVKRADDGIRKEISPIRSSKELSSKVPPKASGKRLGRPPKKGTHLNVNSLGHLASAPSSKSVGIDPSSRKRSPQSSPERDNEDVKKRRKRSPSKRMTNGQRESSDHRPEGSSAALHRDRLWMMMGGSLNPNSTMAEEMDNVLKNEIQAHSAYDTSMRTNYHQVPLPGGKRAKSSTSSSAATNATSNDGRNKDQPQTLDELLERQWEQGSQFLMEQASHFDIASLLSSLHQLKEENLDLEFSVDRMVQRRDHLLAVRARLLALSSLTVATPANSNSQTGGGSVTPSGAGSNHTTPERERYAAAVAQQTSQSPIGGTTVVNVGTANGPSPASGRSSAHVSPRNSAATISPIRVGGGGASAILSPRAPSNLPPPPSSQVQMPPGMDRPTHNPSYASSSASIHMQPPPAHSPRDRINSRPSSGGPLGIGGPSPHPMHGAPSPRDRGQAPTSSPRHITGNMTPSPHSRDSRLSPRIPSSTTVIPSGSVGHGSLPIENGIDYPHSGAHSGALPPHPHGAIPISSPTPNLPPGTMIHPRHPSSTHNIPQGHHGDLGPPPQPRSGGPVSSSHLLSVASHPTHGRGVSINTVGSSGPPQVGGGVVYTTYTTQAPTTSLNSGPPPRQSSMSHMPASSGMPPAGAHGQQQAYMPPRSSPHHAPSGSNIYSSQRGGAPPPPHIPSSLGGGATTIMTAVSSSIGPPPSSGLPPLPPRSTTGMMVRPMTNHGGPPSSGGPYRPGGPPRSYHGMPPGQHGPPPPGHGGMPPRSPAPSNSHPGNMRSAQGRMVGPAGGMMSMYPQEKR